MLKKTSLATARSQWVGAYHHAWPCVRVLFSAVLLFLALRKVDWMALFQAHYAVRPAWLALAVPAILLANLLSGLRWSWLLQHATIAGSRHRHVGLYFAGALINQGVPTVIGGDVYRTLLVSDAATRRQAVAAVILDRFLGSLGNNLLGAAGLLAAGTLLGRWAPMLGGSLLIATLSFLAIIDISLRMPRLHAMLDRLGQRFKLSSTRLLMQNTFALPRGLAQAALALLIHALTLLALECCLLAFNLSPPLPILMIWLSVLSLLMILPISVSGWGLRETTLASTLGYWGLAPDKIVLASVCYGAITLMALLPGLPWLLHGRPASLCEETA